MPRSNSFRLVLACALALSMTLVFTALAAAKGLPADLRVVGSGSKVLAEKTVASADVSIAASRKPPASGRAAAAAATSCS